MLFSSVYGIQTVITEKKIKQYLKRKLLKIIKHNLELEA